MLPHRAFGGAAPSAVKSDDPHFFLQVVVAGGLDGTYLLDARPLEMTASGLQQNAATKEPTHWEGNNGARTLAASPVEVLRPFQSDICVVNGVFMSTSFDGHPQNRNILLTGNPFGGTPALSRLNSDKPLDYLAVGDFGADIEGALFVPLTAAGARGLHAKLSSDGNNPSVDAYLSARCSQAGAGQGRFSAGARALGNAAAQSGSLADRLRALQLPPASASNDGGLDAELQQNLAMVAQFFRHGIVPSALIDLTGDVDFDVHSAEAAKAQIPLYETLTKQFAQILAYLKSTPFDATRTLLDVTTVMFASEFTRSMRQLDRPIDDTGTDHNAFANSILFAGKGIRAGAVLGGSDFQSSGEAPSGAHLSLDPQKLKRVGLPVDFDTGLFTGARPEAYTSDRYLGIASIVNALYTLFGVDRQYFWAAARNEPVAPVFNALIVAV